MSGLKLQQFYNHLAKNPDKLSKVKKFDGDMTALAAYAHELGYEVTAEDLTAYNNKTKQALESKWKELDAGKASMSFGAKQFMEFSKLADTDEEVAMRITEASKSPQELIAYGKEKGFVFDTKDMKEVAKKLMEQEEELSDEELEAVAGGTTATFVVLGILAAGMVVAFGVTAAVNVAAAVGEW